MMTVRNTMHTSSSNCTCAAGTFVRDRIAMDTALLAVSIIIIPLIALLGIVT